MPRDLPLGNGALLVTFDCDYRPRDIYFPHVGSENHTDGQPFRFGVWADGQFSWVSSETWDLSMEYEDETLVTRVSARSRDMSLSLALNDAVDFHENVLVRRITVQNDLATGRDVRLFFCHDFNIYGTEIADTAYYDPHTASVIHYKGNRWFLICGCDDTKCGIDQFATGVKRRGTAQGTWRDAEDGVLQGNPVTQGAVDSVVALHLSVPGQSTAEGYYWMAVGNNYEQVALLNRLTHQKQPQELLRRTANYWRLWVNKEGLRLDDLPEECGRLFKRSLLVIRTQVDHGGGVLAANDSDITPYSSDTYSYVWPRDGALVCAALSRAGYPVLTRRFFDFCAKAITQEGYLLHKYNADGSVASSWHPLYADGEVQLPIQEDETALVLWALWQHHESYRDIEFIKHLYRPLIIAGGKFLQRYRRASSGLPRPSWDLWEERRGVHAFTCAAAYGGLIGSAGFARAFGETEYADEFSAAAQDIRDGFIKHCYHEQLARFARMATETEDGYELDMTVDSSLAGLFLFGMFEADDPRVVSTMEAVRRELAVPTATGGIARYQGDPYQRPGEAGPEIPGNPWFVSTLWVAQWQVARARTQEDLREVVPTLQWAAKRALASGVLAEQVHPFTDEPLSVAPLTWSHSAFVSAVLDYMHKLEQLSLCRECGASLKPMRGGGPDAGATL